MEQPEPLYTTCENWNCTTTVMDWMSVSPQNSYGEILTPNLMAFEGGAFGRWLGRKSGALISGTSAPVKGTPELSPIPSTM